MKVFSAVSASLSVASCLIYTSDAFQPSLSSRSSLSTQKIGQASRFSIETALFQAKPKNSKKQIVAKEPAEKEKQTGISLLFTYMTPWRNPNSIFVYMFGLLYALGKYSESH